uniref:Uncharacterized protein n=1 Tax=Leersia perrieri TaxID=77586 RepID=A0A0D9WN07_9ORYZ
MSCSYGSGGGGGARCGGEVEGAMARSREANRRFRLLQAPPRWRASYGFAAIRVGARRLKQAGAALDSASRRWPRQVIKSGGGGQQGSKAVGSLLSRQQRQAKEAGSNDKEVGNFLVDNVESFRERMQ